MSGSQGCDVLLAPASVCSRGGRERDPSEVVRSSRSGEGDRVVPLVNVSYSPNSSDQS